MNINKDTQAYQALSLITASEKALSDKDIRNLMNGKGSGTGSYLRKLNKVKAVSVGEGKTRHNIYYVNRSQIEGYDYESEILHSRGKKKKRPFKIVNKATPKVRKDPAPKISGMSSTEVRILIGEYSFTMQQARDLRDELNAIML